MKAILRFTAILAVVMGSIAVSAYAQGVAKQQTFVVPFEFNVGQKVLSPSEYRVIADTHFIRIQSKDGKQNLAILPLRTSGAVQLAGSKSKLTFRRYGDHYYLSQIWLPDGIGRELIGHRPNSDLTRNASMVEVVTTAR